MKKEKKKLIYCGTVIARIYCNTSNSNSTISSGAMLRMGRCEGCTFENRTFAPKKDSFALAASERERDTNYKYKMPQSLWHFGRHFNTLNVALDVPMADESCFILA